MTVCLLCERLELQHCLSVQQKVYCLVLNTQLYFWGSVGKTLSDKIQGKIVFANTSQIRYKADLIKRKIPTNSILQTFSCKANKLELAMDAGALCICYHDAGTQSLCTPCLVSG